MNMKNIILGIIVLIILYVLYLYYFGDASKKALVGMHDATVQTTVSAGSMPPGTSSNYTFSIWVYVSDWNYGIGKFKPVFVRGKSGGPPVPVCPMVKFDKNVNNLIIDHIYGPVKGTDENANFGLQEITLENIPLQKWTNIIMSLNNRAMDLYLDGKLVKTTYFKGVPAVLSDADLTLTPSMSGTKSGDYTNGFKGYTAKFLYYSRSINPREAYTIYKEGFGGNWLSDLFNKYKIKIAFMKGAEEVNSFEI